MFRTVSRRLATGVAAALVGSMLLGVGGAGAANTRSLWIGDPSGLVDANGDGIPDNPGHLLPTAVTLPPPAPAPANATMFQVEVLSTDNQTLAHTVLTINANYQNVAGLSLDPNVPFYASDPTSPTDASFCSASGTTITCNFGNLAAGAHRTIAVVVDVASTYNIAGPTPLFFASVTTNNENGSNLQTFTADSGTFQVSAFNADQVNSFVPPGQQGNLGTSPLGTTGAGNLSSTVGFKVTGAEIVAVTDGTNLTLAYQCPPGLTCQPDISQVITSSPSFSTSPYFTWTLTALVPKTYTLSKGFVAHYLDGTTTYDWILYFKDKSALCGSNIGATITAQGHCISYLNLSKPVGNFETLTVTVVMDHQGGMRF